ncbi:hypothetical protein NDU88_005112 [Pleurodeles waltl]|uniref:Uncharacterized protein n=1 Tax=Pleurodeles waltl TaxID=8319 RepID=A0AAV7V314_PLEWA|nr:hypothetical protein NDU88_005112 [Pleurodeles waltl]
MKTAPPLPTGVAPQFHETRMGILLLRLSPLKRSRYSVIDTYPNRKAFSPDRDALFLDSTLCPEQSRFRLLFCKCVSQ